VPHLYAACDQSVGNELPMASPPQRLGTHDRNAGLKGPRHISGRDRPFSPRHIFM